MIEIPKILHFIWIGTTAPKYVNFAVNSFAKANPNFEIHFVNEDINDIKTFEIRQIKALYQNKINHIPISIEIDPEVKKVFDLEFSNISWSFKEAKFRNNMAISINHIYRVYCIYRYGGIYLDNDMFPVKSFDINILSTPFVTYCDNCWFGGYKGDLIITNMDTQSKVRSDIGKYMRTIYSTIPGYEKYDSPRFFELQKKFYSGTLTIGEKVLQNYDGQDYYIDHYHSMQWSSKDE